MARRIGYGRVSSDDQDLSIQKAALDKDGCGIVFEEKRSGTKRAGRDQLDLAMRVLTKADTLVVTRLDRLGRSLRDLANIAHEIDAAGGHLRVIEQGVDTKTSAGRAFFGMLAVFAQFETDVRRERQAEGIALAKKAGAYKGGKQRIDRREVRALAAKGDGPAAVARALGVSRMSVYRILGERGSFTDGDGTSTRSDRRD